MTVLRRQPRRLAVTTAALAALAVALAGGLMTDVGPWYQGLRQPAWKPPDWLFAPAWTLIFGCAALAAANAWLASTRPRVRRRILVYFGLNGVLNVLWSWLFFYRQRPDWALVEVVLLWLSVALLLAFTIPLGRQVSRWLWPYLAWVSIAGLLNLAVVRLNGPFA